MSDAIKPEPTVPETVTQAISAPRQNLRKARPANPIVGLRRSEIQAEPFDPTLPSNKVKVQVSWKMHTREAEIVNESTEITIPTSLDYSERHDIAKRVAEMVGTVQARASTRLNKWAERPQVPVKTIAELSPGAKLAPDSDELLAALADPYVETPNLPPPHEPLIPPT